MIPSMECFHSSRLASFASPLLLSYLSRIRSSPYKRPNIFWIFHLYIYVPTTSRRNTSHLRPPIARDSLEFAEVYWFVWRWVRSDSKISCFCSFLIRLAHVVYFRSPEKTRWINCWCWSCCLCLPLIRLLLFDLEEFGDSCVSVHKKNFKIAGLQGKSGYLRRFDYKDGCFEGIELGWRGKFLFCLILQEEDLESGAWQIRAWMRANPSISLSILLALFPRFSKFLFIVLHLNEVVLMELAC